MSNDSLIGRTLANYRIERPVGRGGMAQVYYATDTKLDRPVALKVIDTRFRGDPEYARRFVDEAKTVASWRHENIVQVYYADKVGDVYFYAMEFIDGASLGELLDAYLRDDELMPHDDVVRIGHKVAAALDYAHEQGVVHRDVKPANVMIDRTDRVILTDFGLALDIEQGSMGQIFGTPHYIAPEQARRSSDAVPQSDIYSLGVMLYEMLTGMVPFDDESATSIAVQHLSNEPPPPRQVNPQLNTATEQVLLRALEKQVETRYQTGAELMDALEEALNQPNDAAAGSIMPPAAVDESTSPAASSRGLSQMSLADKLAVEMENIPTPPTPPRSSAAESTQNAKAVATREMNAADPNDGATVATKRGNNNRGLFVGAAVIGVLVIGGVLFALFGSGGDDAAQALPTEAIIAADATDTPTDVPTDAPTNTPQAQADAPATETPVLPSATPTIAPPTATPVLPTDTAIVPSATPVPPTATQVPPTTAAPAQPTVLYPNGRLLQFIWDTNSFYARNATGNSVRVLPLSFQALDANGNQLPYRFDGADWTVGFSSIESGKCDAIEITTERGLRPGQCRDYNAFVTPQRSNERVFWTGRDGSPQFAVYWDGTEIGRCDISEGLCEQRIPPQ